MYRQESNIISFFYPVDDVFSRAARVSAYNAKNIKDDKGSPLWSEYAITEDDKEIFKAGLESALTEVYDKVLKATNGTDSNSFGIGITKTGEKQKVDADGKPIIGEDNKPVMEDISDECVFFKVKDNGNYNKNVLTLVDTTFLECVIEGSLQSWYKNVVSPDLMALYGKSFSYSLEKLFTRMFQLKVKSVSTVLGKNEPVTEPEQDKE